MSDCEKVQLFKTSLKIPTIDYQKKEPDTKSTVLIGKNSDR